MNAATAGANAARGAATLVESCAGVRAGERALVLFDERTHEVGRFIDAALRGAGAKHVSVEVPRASMHGNEPADAVAAHMLSSDVVFCVTTYSMAHTNARKAATDRGVRFLSLPDYDMDLLSDPCLDVDFASLEPTADRLAGALSAGREISIRTDGCQLDIRIEGRVANSCCGLVRKPGQLGSPPDSETNIAPWEDGSEGSIRIDGSVPCGAVGLLTAPLVLQVRNGRIRGIEGDPRVCALLNGMFDSAGDDSRVLAEFGVGLNPRARLCGKMLSDEGCAGTIHLGFGSNITIGGRNRVAFHLDFVTRMESVMLDRHRFLGPEGLVL